MKKALTYVIWVQALVTICVLPAAAIEFQYNFTSGATLSMRTTSDVAQTMARQGAHMPERSTQNVEATTTQVVQSVDTDGNGTLQIQYDAIVAQAQMGGQNYSWNSADSTEPDYVFAPLTALLNHPVTATLTPKGDVIQLSGLQAIQDAAIAQSKMPVDFGFDMDAASTDVINAAVSQLPDGDIAVNGTWQNSVTLPDPFSGGLVLNANYTYRGQEQQQGYDCARVDFTITVQSVPRMEPHLVKAGGVSTDTQVNLSASGSGQMWFATTEGIIVRYTSNMTVNAEHTVTSEGIAGSRQTERFSTNTTISETSDLVSYTTN